MRALVTGAIERFWSKVNKKGPYPKKYTKVKTRCWVWTGCTRGKGYGVLSVDGVLTEAHRYSYELKYGKGSLGDKCSLHKCDVRRCVRPSHLFKGTKGENNTDRHRKGRSKACFGEQQRSAVLTEKEVLLIRKLYASGHFSHRQLVRRFGVYHPAIAKVLSRKTWRHI